MSKVDFNYILNIEPVALATIDTALMFDIKTKEKNDSPIESFFKKILILNQIHSKLKNNDLDIMQSKNNLIILGYVSAVESFVRELLRKLIILDKSSKISSHGQQLSYGAATSYPFELLPEAILEKYTFISRTSIDDSLRNCIGLKGNLPKDLEKALSEYEIACQLRHCIVHRFGKLGSYNAIKLGLEKHLECIEKPVSLADKDIHLLYQICQNLVLALNSFLFNYILKRTVTDKLHIWKWNYNLDRKIFTSYYNLFYSKTNPNPKAKIFDAYNELRLFGKAQ